MTAHKGQRDKAGLPYILHPLSVMQRVRDKVGNVEVYLVVAVLHDVIEDCPNWHLSDLTLRGFSETVVAGVDSVTKRKGECYPDFVRRSKADVIGRVVKLADVQDNMSRLLTLQYDAKWVQKANIKYNVALAMLSDNEAWLKANQNLVAALESV